MSGVRLLDVTLRDVAAVNDWRFTDPQTAAVAGAIDAAGYDFLEVGYFVPARRLAGEERTGPGVCDPEYLRRVCSGLRRARPAVMVRMSDAPLPALRELAAAGVALVRLPIHAREVRQTAEYVAACHDLGIRVSVNLIFLSQRTIEDVATTAAGAQEAGADVFCVADTLSGLLPDQTTAFVAAAKRELSIPLGFHAHDGLRCAFANALAAIRAGAEIIDSSLGGMGSGGANLMTELVAAYAAREWGRDIDVAALSRVTAAHLGQWVNGDIETATEAALAGLLNLNTRQRAAAKEAAAGAGVPLLEHLNAELRARAGTTRAGV